MAVTRRVVKAKIKTRARRPAKRRPRAKITRARGASASARRDWVKALTEQIERMPFEPET